MSNDMEDSTRLTDLNDHRQHHHHRARTHDIGDDECSTDSGCSSGGSSSTGSGLSRRNSGERLCRSGCAPRMLEQRLRGRSTRSQERLDSRSSERTWSPPEDARSRGGVSPLSYSSSPSEAHSSNDSDFLKRPSSTAETLRRAFQSLKLVSSKWESGTKDSKKHAKKSPKRILRSPVPYVYVRGPSGLPTQRVPRNSALQHQMIHPYSCQDLIGLYR